MANYIDRTYVENMLTEAQVASLLSYGDNTDSQAQDDKLDSIIEIATSIVNSFLAPAGYNLPLSTVPAVIKGITFWLTVNQLFAACQQPIPEYMQTQVANSVGMLELLRDKKMILEGLQQDSNTGTGGNTFGGGAVNSGTGAGALIMPFSKLRGTFF